MLGWAGHLRGLRALGRATIHAGALDARGRPKLDHFVLNLNRQLARGGQAQHNGAVAGRCR
jgi:hypothetical protein